jgi:hypothetical protein
MADLEDGGKPTGVVNLLAERAGNVTGANFVIDGGLIKTTGSPIRFPAPGGTGRGP